MVELLLLRLLLRLLLLFVLLVLLAKVVLAANGEAIVEVTVEAEEASLAVPKREEPSAEVPDAPTAPEVAKAVDVEAEGVCANRAVVALLLLLRPWCVMCCDSAVKELSGT